jgi:hypothetical protein
MKKFVIAVAVLLLAAPTWATDVNCTVDGCDVTVHYSGAGAGPVRGMAFDIEVDGDGVISDVVCLSAAYGYQIFPGDISISGSGIVEDYGTCKCDGGYPGTLDASNGMTIEMGSLYEAGVDPDPCDAGDLVSFRVAGTGTITVSIAVNTIRGGVVNEDAGTQTPGITGCQVELIEPDPNIGTCWDAAECGGQPLGDGTCDGGVNFGDLAQLKIAIFTTKGQALYDCCADYNHDNGVNFGDLAILKINIFTSGHTPATLNQDCPP